MSFNEGVMEDISTTRLIFNFNRQNSFICTWFPIIVSFSPRNLETFPFWRGSFFQMGWVNYWANHHHPHKHRVVTIHTNVAWLPEVLGAAAISRAEDTIWLIDDRGNFKSQKSCEKKVASSRLRLFWTDADGVVSRNLKSVSEKLWRFYAPVELRSLAEVAWRQKVWSCIPLQTLGECFVVGSWSVQLEVFCPETRQHFSALNKLSETWCSFMQ